MQGGIERIFFKDLTAYIPEVTYWGRERKSAREEKDGKFSGSIGECIYVRGWPWL
jgi:hypothetical protein